jgi:hypothetical protein
VAARAADKCGWRLLVDTCVSVALGAPTALSVLIYSYEALVISLIVVY